jgi:hypothetical protein
MTDDENYRTQYAQAREAIIASLRASGGSSRESELIERVAKESGIDDAIVAQVTWDLVHDDTARYAPGFKMQLVGSGQ